MFLISIFIYWMVSQSIGNFLAFFNSLLICVKKAMDILSNQGHILAQAKLCDRHFSLGDMREWKDETREGSVNKLGAETE